MFSNVQSGGARRGKSRRSAAAEKKLWVEAYEFAHVGADLTSKGFEGKAVDLSWLEAMAKGLLITVRMLKKRKAPEPRVRQNRESGNQLEAGPKFLNNKANVTLDPKK